MSMVKQCLATTRRTTSTVLSWVAARKPRQAVKQKMGTSRAKRGYFDLKKVFVHGSRLLAFKEHGF